VRFGTVNAVEWTIGAAISALSRSEALTHRSAQREGSPMSVDHYENFPVASVLCPPALRPAVTAIYRFARTADDIADEGDATSEQRRAQLAAYGRALDDAAHGRTGTDWPDVFAPLAREIVRHRLPLVPLHDLLSAFTQDTHNPTYADRTALLDYCARSANPIGRLLLHLCAVDEPAALRQSDAVCSALQLINFWQDVSIDLPRGRCYLPLADAQRHGVHDVLSMRADSDASRALLRELCHWARALMAQGAPLVHRLPGRFGWELRFVVQGGLRVLDKIEHHGFNAMTHRPTVGVADAPLLAWRALRMRSMPAAALTHDRALP
jgi:hydroxysqualene synthase